MRADEQPGVAALDLEEQRRATGRQVVADLLHELAVDAGGRPPDRCAARDGADHHPGQREHHEQQPAEHGADRPTPVSVPLDASLWIVTLPAASLRTTAVSSSLIRSLVLERADRLERRLGVIGPIERDRQEIRHRRPSSRPASPASEPPRYANGEAGSVLPHRPDRARRGRAAVRSALLDRLEPVLPAGRRGRRCGRMVDAGDLEPAFERLDAITNDGTVAVDTATLVEFVLLGQAIRAG